jgi:hypothetical protein
MVYARMCGGLRAIAAKMRLMYLWFVGLVVHLRPWPLETGGPARAQAQLDLDRTDTLLVISSTASIRHTIQSTPVLRRSLTVWAKTRVASPCKRDEHGPCTPLDVRPALEEEPENVNS